ncbi:uncharacterized protein LOC106170982 [Lingula anatina]|uniref:Uncharacterized protein LOC106170982 n=1 Tax=Lingula anatina TaxID=7574 RepID=A0A1S3J7Y5_LINAN|nr:uncharacterized protein LOC106170982 [Lingula anatina]|eukprot:XP_013406510.1 uncharacterized protein LOC106170982 [Lingula anatina]
MKMSDRSRSTETHNKNIEVFQSPFDRMYEKRFGRRGSGALERVNNRRTEMSNEMAFSALPLDKPIGLRRWTAWRTRLNHGLIDLALDPFLQSKFTPETEPTVFIDSNTCDFALHYAVADFPERTDINLDAETYVSFGIPRAKVQRPTSAPSSANFEGTRLKRRPTPSIPEEELSSPSPVPDSEDSTPDLIAEEVLLECERLYTRPLHLLQRPTNPLFYDENRETDSITVTAQFW